MSLPAHLAVRLALVTLLCLCGAAVWSLREAGAGLRAEATISAERIAVQFERQPGLGSAGPTVRFPAEPTGAPALLTLLPGICAEIRLLTEAPRRVCAEWDGLDAPPRWLPSELASDRDADPVERVIRYRGRAIGSVAAWPDPDAAASRIWRHLKLSGGLALAIAGVASALGWIVTAGLVAPVSQIVRRLEGIDAGAGRAALPRFAAREFDRIALACNGLASRLAAAEAERVDLLRRLVAVQEDERQVLARDLHDAFGQSLAAVGARAMAIEAGAPPDREDLREDARGIEAVAAAMRATLREALGRLELPDLAEIGVADALRDLVSEWQGHVRAGPQLHLDTVGDLSGLSPEASAGLYRIAQELLTNAVRHGRPSRVFLRLETGSGAASLTVDDDGGGDASRAARAPGRGLTGIRARLAALGGELSLTGTGSGLRARAVVPLAG